VNVEPFEALVRNWRAEAHRIIGKNISGRQGDRASLVHGRLLMCADDLENAIKLAIGTPAE